MDYSILKEYCLEREKHIESLIEKYFGKGFTWSHKKFFRVIKFIFYKIINMKCFKKHFENFVKDLFDLGYTTKEIEVAKDRFKGFKDNYIRKNNADI